MPIPPVRLAQPAPLIIALASCIDRFGRILVAANLSQDVKFPSLLVDVPGFHHKFLNREVRRCDDV